MIRVSYLKELPIIKDQIVSGSMVSIFNIAVWFGIFAIDFFGMTVIKSIIKIGFIEYFKTRSIIGRIIVWLYKYIKKTVHYVTKINLNEDNNKYILKLVLINAGILLVLSFIWFFGIPFIIIYSVILFILIRKYVNDISGKYKILTEATNEIAEGNLDVKIEEDLGVFNPFKDNLEKIQCGFKKAVQEEVKSQRMKTDLISNVSHDLKTPLTAIITYIDLLKDKNLSEEKRIEYLDVVDRKSQRLQELIEDLPDGEEISFYKQGDFTDLCAGPHLTSTGKVKAVKILSSSGAYWRGSEKNKMLQRIYAISFPKASELEEHLQLLEEAKQRDHRKIAKEQELFMTHELVGSGLPLYLPNGATIRRILERYIQDKEISMGYKHVYTPSLANSQLYKTSGHWDHYKEDMFPVMKLDNEEMVLRPMNCPHHMLIYKNRMHSYRDLPIRIGELAHDFRYEASGSVCGLERVREMCQNDAHLFVRPDQIKEEFGNVVKLILSVYKDFGFENYTFRLSLRDKNDKEKYFDDDQMWESAESQLREILTELGLDFYEAEGEAAFYGPKLDVQVKTAVGHDVTVSTCQLDFLLPQRFELEYIGEDGAAHRPVVIHRAILGTFDRFLAFLIEEYKGAFPAWLAPVQVKILPITDNQHEYSHQLEERFAKKGIRVEVDDRNEKTGYKIREAQLAKIPYMLIVGPKEVEKNEVSVRSHKEGDLGAIPVQEFENKILEEVANKK